MAVENRQRLMNVLYIPSKQKEGNLCTLESLTWLAGLIHDKIEKHGGMTTSDSEGAYFVNDVLVTENVARTEIITKEAPLFTDEESEEVRKQLNQEEFLWFYYPVTTVSAKG